MTTIRDVASAAGVSTTTVSHVINRTRHVDPATAAKVEAAIDELGYRPNALARSMRRGRTHTVGVVVPDIASPFFGDLVRTLEDALFAAGYSAIICNSDGDEAKEARYLEVLLSKQVDGVLLIAASQTTEAMRALVASGPPTISVDRELDASLSQVLVDNHGGGYLAAEHLLELGHRDIGIITGPGGLNLSAQRLEGFRAALSDAGVDLAPARVYRGDFRAAGGRAAVAAWLAKRSCPTAIFAENDLMAIGALRAAREAGLELPRQLSVVGFDGIGLGEDMTPPLTTVAQDTADVASSAVDLLFERLRDRSAPPRKIELPVSLIMRGSTSAPASD